MKVRFTKASKKDFNLVTVSLPALRDAGVNVSYTGGLQLDPASLTKGEQFILTIYEGDNGNRKKVLFTVNREGRTATTTAWSLANRPRVGKAALYSVASDAKFV